MKKRLSIFLILYFVGFTIGILCTSLLKKVTQENTALLGIISEKSKYRICFKRSGIWSLIKTEGEMVSVLFYRRNDACRNCNGIGRLSVARTFSRLSGYFIFDGVWGHWNFFLYRMWDSSDFLLSSLCFSSVFFMQ